MLNISGKDTLGSNDVDACSIALWDGMILSGEKFFNPKHIFKSLCLNSVDARITGCYEMISMSLPALIISVIENNENNENNTG